MENCGEMGGKRRHFLTEEIPQQLIPRYRDISKGAQPQVRSLDKWKQSLDILSALAPVFHTLICSNPHLTHEGGLPSLLDEEELAPVCTAGLYSKNYKVASGQHP